MLAGLAVRVGDLGLVEVAELVAEAPLDQAPVANDAGGALVQNAHGEPLEPLLPHDVEGAGQPSFYGSDLAGLGGGLPHEDLALCDGQVVVCFVLRRDLQR